MLKVSEKLGEWFRISWDAAWALHVLGFHEGRFDSEDVKARLSSIERMVKKAASIITHH